jgi:hydroxymethylglutaryl-CoA lyase
MALTQTGVDEIEVTSFVSPKWVPQLGDAASLLDELAAEIPVDPTHRPMLSALVPNERGMTSLIEANRTASRMERGWPAQGPGALVAKASVFTAASETFARTNTNATITETLDRFKLVIAQARAHGLLVRGYISCVIACPFEGPIAPAKVAEVAAQLADLGVDEIDLGDTIGSGTSESIAAMLDAVIARLGRSWLIDRVPGMPGLVLHLHDTFGRAADCVKTALSLGIRSFDGSVAGLGGCPYASTPGRRAPGNIETAALARTIHDAGFISRVLDEPLARASELASRLVAESRAPSDSARGATS